MGIKKYCRIIVSVLIISIIFSIITPIIAMADEEKKNILTLGADLNDEQKQLIINYLNVDLDAVKVIYVNNEDERKYLEGLIDSSIIGKHTYSCAYMEPTTEGGIHIKTVNLTYVDCDMLRNALVTSGITNCNIIAVAPIKVSGTGSLTGIFKAYEEISGEVLSEEKKELAAEELVTTMDIAETIGNEDAASLLNELKQYIIESGLTSKDEITKQLETYLTENSIQITEEQKWQVIELLLKISQQDYDIEQLRQTYEDVQQTISDIKEAAQKAKGIFTKIWEFLVAIFQKLTGTYEEIKKTEEYEMITEQLGILLQTNDSLLGEDTTVTTTEDEEVINEIKGNTSEINESTDTNETLDISSNNDTNEVTFEDFSAYYEEELIAESNNTQPFDNGYLQYVVYEHQELKLDGQIKDDSSNTNQNLSFDRLFE